MNRRQIFGFAALGAAAALAPIAASATVLRTRNGVFELRDKVINGTVTIHADKDSTVTIHSCVINPSPGKHALMFEPPQR